jgi:hypothetical protein
MVEATQPTNATPQRIDEHGYYINSICVITPNCIKIVIMGIVTCFIVMVAAFAFLGALTEGINKNIDLNKFSEENRATWEKTINDVHLMTHPPLHIIILTSIFCGFFGGIILSKTEVELRMNYLKRKYNCANWDQVSQHLRSLGMEYPWWNHELFWEESKDFRVYESVQAENHPSEETLDRPTFDPTWGQL